MEKKVQAPAIALIVLGVLAALASIYGFFSPTDPDQVRQGLEQAGLDQGTIDTIADLSSKAGIAWNVVALALSVLVIFGGLRMKQLRSWGLAAASSVIVMFPCTCCCVIGIPIGIWSLIVLFDKDVKAAFNAPTTPPAL